MTDAEEKMPLLDPIDPISSPPKEPIVYSPEVREVFTEYYVMCKNKYEIHINCARYYNNFYVWTTIPVGILTATVTTLSSINVMQADKNAEISNALIVISTLNTIGHSINYFFEFNVKMAKHINTANKYIDLSRDLEEQLFVETTKTPDSLFELVKKTLLSIENTEPLIPIPINTKPIYHKVGDGVKRIKDIEEFSEIKLDPHHIV